MSPHLEDFRTSDGGNYDLKAYLESCPVSLHYLGWWVGFAHLIMLYMETLSIFECIEVYWNIMKLNYIFQDFLLVINNYLGISVFEQIHVDVLGINEVNYLY